MYKALNPWEHVWGSWDVEKVHTAVARRTFSKSKCTKHHKFAPLLEVEMFKSARRCGAKHISMPKVSKTDGLSGHFWAFRCRFAWQAQGIVHLHLAKSEQNVMVCGSFNCSHHYTTLHPTTQLQLRLQPQPQPHYITLTTLHYTPLRCTTLHSISFNYTALH